MNWHYRIGRAIFAVENWVLSRPWMPLSTVFPYGRNWTYDLSRFAGTRGVRTIIDAGANVGQTALHLRRFFPRATIHCFEPVPATSALLQQAVHRYTQIHVHPFALSSHSGSAPMHIHPNSEQSAVAAFPVADGKTVNCDTLDAFASRTGLTHIDLLKIDVEGHELEVLAGSGRLLSAGQIRSVYIEVGLEGADPSHTYFSSIHAELEKRGFFFSGFYEPWRYPAARHRIAFANALYWHGRPC